MNMSTPKEKKGRVKYLIAGCARHPYSQIYKSLKDQCPALALIAGNIPPKKLSGWNFTDEFYHARFKEIRLCLHGLIRHGACLAAQGNEEQLPALRDFVCALAAFWPDPHEEKDNPLVREEQYGALFDKAVSAAQNGGEVPDLSADRKENILIGLENYIIDLTGQFDEINQEALDSGLSACESIAADLRQTWAEPIQTQSQGPAQPPSQAFA